MAAERRRGAGSGLAGRFEAYRAAYPELAAELERRLAGKLPAGWADGLIRVPRGREGHRDPRVVRQGPERHRRGLPELMGGSADLAPSNNT